MSNALCLFYRQGTETYSSMERLFIHGTQQIAEPSLHITVTPVVPPLHSFQCMQVMLLLFCFLLVLSSKIYMADLESSLHYILRVEVGKFSVLEGHRLMALKKFVAVLAKVSRAATSFVPVFPHVISVCTWKPYTTPVPSLRNSCLCNMRAC